MNNINDFNTIKRLRSDLDTIFTEIETKLNVLTHIYSDMVKTHVDKTYTLGLDSFHFQNKLIQMEYDNMKNVFNFIENRIYCEYYKLLKILYEFIHKEIKDKEIVDKLLITHKHYPVYKDLEPTKIYDFNITTEINNTINNIIKGLKSYLTVKKEELNEKKQHSKMGINIDNMIHQQQYNIIILGEKINMFENYLNTFVNHHSKYFSRLIIKVKLMLGIVNEDFHLKNSKSLHLKKSIKPSNSLSKSNSMDNFQSSDTETETSSNNSIINSPVASMDHTEENNVRFLIGNTEEDNTVHSELNNILQHIPQNEVSEKGGLRNTIKRIQSYQAKEEI